MNMYNKILVAVDGSDIGNAAFECAMQLAKAHSAELFVLYVVEHPSFYIPETAYDPTPIYEALVAEGERVKGEADARLKQMRINGQALVADNFFSRKTAVEEIQDTADALQADLVVLGTHGRSGFKRLMLGSVAEAFVRMSTKPVLLVPQKMSVAASAAS